MAHKLLLYIKIVELKQQDNVAKNIKYLIKKNKISNMVELSKKTNISQAVLYKIVNKNSKSPTIDTFIVLSDFFKVSIDDLLNSYLECKESKNLCKLQSLSNIGIKESNVTILTNIDLSTSAISLKVDLYLKNIPYVHIGDILTFEQVVDDISYPKVCLVRDNNQVSIEMIHLADTDLYINRKKVLGGYKTVLFSEYYSDHAEIIYEVSSTIFR